VPQAATSHRLAGVRSPEPATAEGPTPVARRVDQQAAGALISEINPPPWLDRRLRDRVALIERACASVSSVDAQSRHERWNAHR